MNNHEVNAARFKKLADYLASNHEKLPTRRSGDINLQMLAAATGIYSKWFYRNKPARALILKFGLVTDWLNRRDIQRINIKRLKRLEKYLNANRDSLPINRNGNLRLAEIQRATGLRGSWIYRNKACLELIGKFGTINTWSAKHLGTRRKSSFGPDRTKSGHVRGTQNIGVNTDITMSWVRTRCLLPGTTVSPMETWRSYAEEYLRKVNATGIGGYAHRIRAIRMFIEFYLWKHRFFEPERYFTLPRNVSLPPLTGLKGETPFRANPGSKPDANYVHDFLTWVLETKFSSDEDGHLTTFPGHRIPFARFQNPTSSLDESVRAALQFKYIRDLRVMLAPGKHFKDWKWAQNASGLRSGVTSGDWFEVQQNEIDVEDPDCVWRTREVRVLNYQLPNPDRKRPPGLCVGKRKIVELWSPATSVALLVKLEMPFRTYQVRMLDSGEADRFRVDINLKEENHFLPKNGRETIGWLPGKSLFKWSENPRREQMLSKLLLGDRVRVSENQGIFTKRHDHKIGDFVGFFVNTNKTADIDKDWRHRGYRIDWQHHTLHRWLVKLRNWQEKYNPIETPTLWTALTKNHLGHEKTDYHLSEAAPTCFLFREASARGKGRMGDEAKPISYHKPEVLWGKLLRDLENRENFSRNPAAGHEPLRLVNYIDPSSGVIRPNYPLHALRVSLITALADGGMSLEFLMKLAGHTRLVMTLYYRKVGPFAISDAIRKANEYLEKNADNMVLAALTGKLYEDISAFVACNDDGIRMALPRDPKDRNPVGFERQLGGWCLMGGNPTPLNGGKITGGCFNGGKLLQGNHEKGLGVYASVRTKACIECNCRWFVSRPEYILEIKARMDLTATNLTVAQRRFDSTSRALEELRREKLRAAQEQRIFSKVSEIDTANRIHERAASEVDFLAQALSNGARLVDRVLSIASITDKDAERQHDIVAQGSASDVQQAIKGIDSGLLNASGFSSNAEVYFAPKNQKKIVPKWGFEPVSPLLQLTSVTMNAEAYPELETESFGAILERSQHLETALRRKGYDITFSNLSSDQQLRICNRLMRDLAAPLNGNLDATVERLQQDSALPASMGKVLKDGIAKGDFGSTSLAKLLS